MCGTYYVREKSISTGSYCSSTLYSGTYEECERWVKEQVSKDPVRYKYVELVIQYI